MREAYKNSFKCVTMEVKVIENGRKIDKMVVTDTATLRKLIKKYSLK